MGFGAERPSLLRLVPAVSAHRLARCLPVDAEWPFLLEDLKYAGAPAQQLLEIRDAFKAQNEAAGRKKCEAAASRAHDAEGSADDSDSGAVRSVALKWQTMEDELDGIACFIQQALRRANKEGVGLAERAVLVAVPNMCCWARLAQKALVRRQFTMGRSQLGYTLGGFPRDARKTPALVVFNRLNLLANPCDPLAWRVWCGQWKRDLGAAAWARFLSKHEGIADVVVALKSYRGRRSCGPCA